MASRRAVLRGFLCLPVASRLRRRIALPPLAPPLRGYVVRRFSLSMVISEEVAGKWQTTRWEAEPRGV